MIDPSMKDLEMKFMGQMRLHRIANMSASSVGVIGQHKVGGPYK